jgi:hypothetical protein
MKLRFKSIPAVQITQPTLIDVKIVVEHAIGKFVLIFRRLLSWNFNVFVQMSQHSVKGLWLYSFGTLGGILCQGR